jgi:hypothetical protein
MQTRLNAIKKCAPRSVALLRHYVAATQFLDRLERQYNEPLTPHGFVDLTASEGIAAR